jgi:hypothetical protein
MFIDEESGETILLYVRDISDNDRQLRLGDMS